MGDSIVQALANTACAFATAGPSDAQPVSVTSAAPTAVRQAMLLAMQRPSQCNLEKHANNTRFTPLGEQSSLNTDTETAAQQTDRRMIKQTDDKVSTKKAEAKSDEKLVAGTALPEGWENATDANSGVVYYFNRDTGARQWEHPGLPKVTQEPALMMSLKCWLRKISRTDGPEGAPTPLGSFLCFHLRRHGWRFFFRPKTFSAEKLFHHFFFRSNKFSPPKIVRPIFFANNLSAKKNSTEKFSVEKFFV